jgi:hypothetical protein
MRGRAGADRRLYRDLAKLLRTGRGRPLCDLEREIEERFRRHLATEPLSPADTLCVTLSWQFPEGGSSWALYTTEFRVETRGLPVSPSGSEAANVVPFPGRRRAATEGRRR